MKALSVRTLEYFYIRVEDDPGRAYELLAKLASEEVNLLAFSAVPYGDKRVELTIFPDRTESLLRAAASALRAAVSGRPVSVSINTTAREVLGDGQSAGDGKMLDMLRNVSKMPDDLFIASDATRRSLFAAIRTAQGH